MEQNWTTIIKPNKKKFDFNVKELIQYKDLIYMFVKRNFTSQYKQTVLGPLWFVFNPLLTTFISTLVFGGIAGIKTGEVPYFLFYLCGYTLWSYFSTCVSQTAATFTGNVGIMGKVYFPRLTMPIATIIFSLINTLIVFCMTLITMLVYGIKGVHFAIDWHLALVPLLFLQTALLGLGVGIVISSLTTKYRDLAVLVTFGLQLWMYITPVVYPATQITGKLKSLLMLNPMSPVINNMHYVLLGVGEFEWNYWIVSVVVTIVILIFGVGLFGKVEKTFMDTV